jgi:electron transfer flavoprotein beta subunit
MLVELILNQHLRKALAIGANEAIRVNATPTDGFFVAKQLAEVAKNGNYDLVICGKESLDYNGGMVPGMLATLLNLQFCKFLYRLTLLMETSAKVIREIDGGKETISTSLTINYWWSKRIG